MSCFPASTEPSYMNHRVNLTISYWLSVFDSPAPSAAPLELVLAQSGLELHFTRDAAPITTFADFSAYFAQIAKGIATAAHTIQNLTIQPAPGTGYAASFDLDYKGTNDKGEALAARTHHEWTIRETGEPIPRIQKLVSTYV